MMILPLVLSALFAALASGSSILDCPPGLQDQYTSVHGDMCYRFELSRNLEYFDAEKFCSGIGGHLAMVKSAAINSFLTAEMNYIYQRDTPVWIGLNDAQYEGDFRWVDGSEMEYDNFIPNEEGPRGGLNQYYEDCVALDPSFKGQWRDYRCEDTFFGYINEHKPFICQIPIVKRPIGIVASTSTSTSPPPSPSSSPSSSSPSSASSSPPTTMGTGPGSTSNE